MSRVAVLCAQGLEECEGLIVVDILRRAKIETDIISVDENREVISSHNIHFISDNVLRNLDSNLYDAIVLPGGMPGTRNLQNNNDVVTLVQEYYKKGKLVCAICAAPVILETAGIASGINMTVHHTFTEEMTSCVLHNKDVVVDGNIITGWGLGAAIPFSLSIVEQLKDQETADSIREAIGYIH